MQLWNPSTSFVRPNDTNAYAIGDLVANSITAGQVAPMAFAPGNSYGVGQFRLVRARLSKTGTGVSTASFRVHLYGAQPTPANGDNGVWSTDQAANWLGNIDVTSMLTFTDGACGTGSLPAGSEALVRLASGKQVFALIEARAAYTPVANEAFTLTLEDLETY